MKMRVKVISGKYNVGKEAEIIGWDFTQEKRYYNLLFKNPNGECERDDGYLDDDIEFIIENDDWAMGDIVKSSFPIKG